MAVASGKVGYALFVGQRLTEWGTSRISGLSPVIAIRTMKKWLVRFEPDVVVNEDIAKSSRKGDRTRSITEAIAQVACNQATLLDIAVQRVQAFPNKYDEAEALAEEFPALEPHLPKRRRLWDTESPRTILIEAVALAKQLFANPAPAMARAMG